MSRRRVFLMCLPLIAAPRAVDAQPAPDAAPPAEAAAEIPPETGTLAGRVIDADTQVGLPAAELTITDARGAVHHAVADLEGNYQIALPPGDYTVVATTPEYGAQQQRIAIAAHGAASLDLALAMPHTSKEETIEVYSALDTRKDSAILAERRASATVSDAISAQQIARSPDSNASDAAKRMVSATIQDNRYLVVRGLGGRYSTTLLNGVPLPSPDPDVPAAPLDLFPAALITNLTVHKTFAPNLPGNFAGGALGIETRSYPTSLLVKARVGLAANSRASFRTINGQSGGSLDALGYDDGARALPSAIPDDKLAGDYQLTPAQRNSQLASFKNNWTIDRGTVGPNLGVGATIGDSLRVSGQRIGYLASASFGHSYAQRTAHIARVGGDDGAGGRAPSVLQLDDAQGLEQANLGAVGGIGWTPASGHKLDAFALYAHTADISSSEITGTDNSTAHVDRTRLQFLQRELLFTQLVGDDRLADGLSLSWQGNVARVAQHEPDTRDLLRTQTPDGRWAISGGAGGAERLFGELSDTTLGGAAALKLAATDRVALEAGGAIQRSARDYQARRFHIDISGDAAFLSPDQAFAPSNAGGTMNMYEATLPSDGYNATRSVAAGYAMVDARPTDALRLIGGARFEHAGLDIGLDSKLDLMSPLPAHTVRSDNDVLPSLNLVYAVSPTMNLRAAYAMTVARPNFREVAPALYYDYVRRRVIGGNPDLRETQIHNGDLRWEQFFGDQELVSASVFAKRFSQPIERTVESAGDGDNVGFANASSATTYGVELEARLSLGRLAPQLAAFSIGGNLSLIHSSVDTGGAARALQGQSPYVANLALGYEHATAGTRIDLAFNTFGRRIEEVGTAGAGDVYEQPFHRLDLTVSQPLPRSLRLKLAGGNLLNARVVRTQDDVEIFAYPVGVTVIGSVEYSLE